MLRSSSGTYASAVSEPSPRERAASATLDHLSTAAFEQGLSAARAASEARGPLGAMESGAKPVNKQDTATTQQPTVAPMAAQNQVHAAAGNVAVQAPPIQAQDFPPLEMLQLWNLMMQSYIQGEVTGEGSSGVGVRGATTFRPQVVQRGAWGADASVCFDPTDTMRDTVVDARRRTLQRQACRSGRPRR